MKSKSSKNINVGHGVFGYVIHDKLDPQLSDLVKSSGTYYKGSETELKEAAEKGFNYLTKNDLKGWYYNRSAIIALLDAGVDVFYLSIKIEEVDDIERIDNQNHAAAQEKLKPKD